MEQNRDAGEEEVTLITQRYFSGTSRMIRSSLLAGLPLESLLEVEK
jgi:hypothetical protein